MPVKEFTITKMLVITQDRAHNFVPVEIDKLESYETL